MKKYFETLSLKEDASQAQIQIAYERLSRELDPKNNDHQDFFVEEYKKIQEAYEALSNSSILATENVNIENKYKTLEFSNREDHIQKSNKNVFKYIWKRKKNTTLSILMISILKVILHYSLYPITTRRILGSYKMEGKWGSYKIYSEPYRKTVGEHIDVLFEDELNLFIVATGIVLFVAWFFNDKIKAS